MLVRQSLVVVSSVPYERLEPEKTGSSKVGGDNTENSENVL